MRQRSTVREDGTSAMLVDRRNMCRRVDVDIPLRSAFSLGRVGVCGLA